MFTRWGDAKNARQLAEPRLAEALHTEASVVEFAVLAAPEPNAASQPPPLIALPPPIPADQPMAQPAPNSHSVIGKDLTIEGQSITIRCHGTLEVNGNIQAELHSQQLMVGPSGKVEGTMAAESIDIWGYVSGTIMGARVNLHPSAQVEGDIHAKALSVADGASFEGRSRKVTDPATIAPRLDPQSPSARPAGTEPIQLPRTAQPDPVEGA